MEELETKAHFVIKDFEETVAKYKNNLAVSDQYGSVTYAELNKRVNLLTHRLQNLNLTMNSRIGVLMQPGTDYIASLLAIFKVNGVYVPLNPDDATGHLKYVISEAGCDTIIGDEKSISVLTGFNKRKAVSVKDLIWCRGGNKLTRLGWKGSNFEEIPFETEESDQKPDFTDDISDEAYIFFTSGSTGMPKGILGSHRSLRHFINWEVAEFKIDETFNISQLSTITFDASLRDIFTALTTGAHLHIPPAEVKMNVSKLADWMVEKQISLIHTVPSLFKLFTTELTDQQAENITRLKYIMLAGEPLYAKNIEAWRKKAGTSAEIVNLYGTTETTMISAFYRVPENLESNSDNVPVGKPIAQTVMAIIDEDRVCRPGEIGEIYFKSKYFTKGYLNAELNKSVFVQNPLVKDREDMVYKTGDEGRILKDGNVELLGRKDRQVKVNGIRIELSGLEKAILECENVNDVFINSRQTEEGNIELIAYFVGENCTVDQLQTNLADKINKGLIPQNFVKLDKFPLNRNGKIDVNALPLPSIETPDEVSDEKSEAEQEISELFSIVLGVEDVPLDTSFFALGGSSLKGIQLISRVYKQYGILLKITDIFENNTVRTLAAIIKPSSDRQSMEEAEKLTIQKAKEAETYPLTNAQRRTWIFNQFDQARSAYNIPGAFIITGNVDLQAFEKTFETIVSRHESLRTIFVTQNHEPVQKILSVEEANYQWSFQDLRTLENSMEKATELANAAASKPFDLSAEIPVRIGLLRLKDQEFLLTVTLHHIISDGWSMEVFAKETVALYEAFATGKDNPLAPLPIQYKDFAVWQNEQLSGDILTEHKEYWLAKLADDIPVLDFPASHDRPSLKTFKGVSKKLELGDELSALVNKVKAELNVSTFIIQLAAISALIHRYSRQYSFLLGTPSAERGLEELEDQIGLFLNTVVLKFDLEQDFTFKSLVRLTKNELLQSYEHQVYPFDKLVEELPVERDLSRSALIDILVVSSTIDAVNPFSESNGKTDLSIAQFGTDFSANKYDITFYCNESDGNVSFKIDYNPDLFDEAFIEKMSDHLRNLMSSMLSNTESSIQSPSYLTDQEFEKNVIEFNKTDFEFDREKSLANLFEESVVSFPSLNALKLKDQTISYEELNKRANQLSAFLISNDIKQGDSVGVMTGRNFDMMISMLAILKAGAAYVPIDPQYPVSRQDYIAENSELKFILFDQAYDSLTGKLPEDRVAVLANLDLSEFDISNPNVSVAPDSLAYTIYTSGSTGKPKGVMISHQSAVNLIQWINKEFNVSEKDKMLFLTSMCFDLSVYDIFGIMAAGGTVIIAENEDMIDPSRIVSLIDQNQITFWDTVPSTMNFLTNYLDSSQQEFKNSSLRLVFMSGDWIPVSLPDRLRKYFTKTQVISLGGATEGTVWSNYFPVNAVDPSWKSIPYGKPIGNNKFYILDEHQNPVAENCPGDLYIGGIGVSLGYKNEPEKNKNSFFADPFVKDDSSARMYKTGDLGRLLPGGNMEFLGRIDQQVKIRGFRVELGEIENCLLTHDSVQDAAVIITDGENGNKILVAFYVGDEQLNVAGAKEHLIKYLPDYMIPDFFIAVDSIPLNVNGKVDKKFLAEQKLAFEQEEREIIAPENETEQAILKIYQSILNMEKISVTDSFFELGGNSFNVIQLLNEINNIDGIALEVYQIYSNPTVKGLAELTGVSTEEKTEIKNMRVEF